MMMGPFIATLLFASLAGTADARAELRGARELNRLSADVYAKHALIAKAEQESERAEVRRTLLTRRNRGSQTDSDEFQRSLTGKGEAALDFLGNIVGVDTKCDHEKKKYKDKMNHHKNQMNSLKAKEAKLVTEFGTAEDQVKACQRAINNKFDHYGCNLPEKSGKTAMENDLNHVQENCINHHTGRTLWPFERCYNNEGSTALRNRNEIVSHYTIAQCRQLAANHGSSHFGMEYPEGSGGHGQAQCWYKAKPEYVEAMEIRDNAECQAEGHTNPRLGAANRMAWYKTAYNGQHAKNFQDLKAWMQAIDDEAAPIPQQVENERAAWETARNHYNEWNQKCSFGGFFEDVFGGIADAVKAVAKAVASAVEAIMKAIGCMIVDIGLSVVGAILDVIIAGVMATFTGGAFPASLPYYPMLCLDFGAGGGTTKGKDGWVDDWAKAQSEATIKATGKEALGTEMQKKGIEAYATANVAGCYDFQSTLINCPSLLEEGGATNRSRLESHLAINKNNNALQERIDAGFGMQDAMEWLFKFVMLVLGELGKNPCCGKLKTFLDGAGGDWINTIMWFILRIWDALCGKFGTFIMEIIKQFALCNMCDFCPKSACTLKFLAFGKCKAYYGEFAGLLEAGGATERTITNGTLSVKEIANMGVLGSWNTDRGDEFEYHQGNDGRQDCHQWCLSRNAQQAGKKITGAIGAELYSVDLNGKIFDDIEMFAESPLHMAVYTTSAKRSVNGGVANGNYINYPDASSPCCPAGKGKTSRSHTCNACMCGVAPEQSALRHGKVVALYSPVHKVFMKQDNNRMIASPRRNNGFKDIPTGWGAERFRLVDLGHIEEGAWGLWGTHYKKFVRMNGNDMDSSGVKDWDKMPTDWTWELFKPVAVDDGKKIAFHSTVHNKFIRMRNDNDMDASGAKAMYSIPTGWSWERFEMYEVPSWQDGISLIAPYIGRVVALYCPIHKRFARMNGNGRMDASAVSNDINSIPTGWGWERFRIVSNGDKIAFESTWHSGRFVKMEGGNGGDMGWSPHVANGVLPTGWASEVFTPVNAGNGQVAFHNSHHNSYMRMNGNADMDASGHMGVSSLPGGWTWERFTIYEPSAWN